MFFLFVLFFFVHASRNLRVSLEMKVETSGSLKKKQFVLKNLKKAPE